MVLQAEGNNLIRTIHELQMLTHKVGRTETECGMVFPKGNKSAVVIEHLRIAFFVHPVELVDAVRRLIAVVYPLLRAQQFLTAKHEGNAL